MEAKIITVSYARQKLGDRGKLMSDKDINELLATIRFLCNKSIDTVVNKKE